MTDAVAQALAQRRGLDSGCWTGTVASAVVHFLAAALLFGVGFRAAAFIPVPAAPSIPLGEVIGVPSPSYGSSIAAPERVLKPPASTRTPRASSVPLATPSSLQAIPIGAGQDAAASASTGGGSPVTLGDPNGVSSPYSWYLAGVQAKVRAIWLSQLHPAFVTPVEVQFTILEDGSLTAPIVVTPSGDIALDLAATRAIVSAAPFAPLPKDLQAKPFTIRAQFRAER